MSEYTSGKIYLKSIWCAVLKPFSLTLHLIAVRNRASQTCHLKLLKEKLFTYDSFACSNLSSFVVNPKSNHFFFNSSQPSRLCYVDLRHRGSRSGIVGRVLAACLGFPLFFPKRIKMIHYRAYIFQIKYPMFIYHRR